MSRYVQRCLGCRQVRGVSAFGVRRGGGRREVCRWCEETAKAKADALQPELRRLLQKRAELVERLAKTDVQIRGIEAELLAAEQQPPPLDRRRSA